MTKWKDWLLKLCHIETIFIIIVFLLVVYYAFINPKKAKNKIEVEVSGYSSYDLPTRIIKKKKKKVLKHESKCREIFQDIFNVKFKSIRPGWLKNPATGNNLELDGYNETIKTKLGQGLAWEYDGQQHSKYTPHFHKHGPSEFVYQVKKDEWKDIKCKEHGILLIRIPHFVAYQDLERYIKNKLRKHDLYDSGNGLYD